MNPKKTQSAAHHVPSEDGLDRLTPLLNRESYLRILKHFYSFAAPLEEALDEFLSLEEVMTLLENRKKSMWRVNEFASLGMDGEDLFESANVPKLSSFSHYQELLGVQFVTEHATYGRKLLRSPISNFRAFGDDIEKLWKNFHGELLSQCSDPEEQEDIVSAAKETFDTLEDWLINQDDSKIPLQRFGE